MPLVLVLSVLLPCDVSWHGLDHPGECPCLSPDSGPHLDPDKSGHEALTHIIGVLLNVINPHIISALMLLDSLQHSLLSNTRARIHEALKD